VRPLEEQSHYEVLEIERGASREEVERAYRLGQATYADDSMAAYSVLGPDDLRAARERVELAYEVLSDPIGRERYDAGLAGHPDEAEPEPEPSEESLLLPLPPESEQAAPVRRRVETGIEGFEDVDDEAEGGTYDGARLRRARLVRGLEIAQIAAVTKINPTYLHCIEDERFDALPAPVYVRGFVTAYARCLGLQAESVALSYMERVQGRRQESRATRGRRA